MTLSWIARVTLVVTMSGLRAIDAQEARLCTRPRPLAACRDYVDLEFQVGTRWAAGAVAMRNVSDSIALGVSVLGVIHDRSPGGIALELRRRRWNARRSAVDFAFGPLWTQSGAGGRVAVVPNGAVGGINLMHNEHFGVFGRVSHMRRRNEAAETRVGIGVQSGRRTGVPVLAIAAALAVGLLYMLGGS
jgi:hypothetical protein